MPLDMLGSGWAGIPASGRVVKPDQGWRAGVGHAGTYESFLVGKDDGPDPDV
jgi:hypothetical protein